MRYDVEAAIGVLNGAIGDYLARRGNGLATTMQFARAGKLLDPTTEAFAREIPSPSPRVVISIHGLMSTESVWELDDGTTYGSRLEASHGATALDVRFNSGLHISENGEALDRLLGDLVRVYPREIERIDLIGHSMGGLVIRSATHAASASPSAWLEKTKRAYYVGSPHLGAPLERFGNVLTWALKRIGKMAREPVTELVADIIALRSSGVKDLRYGNLRAEDWTGVDADALLQNSRHPVPLLPGIRHHLVAATLIDDPIVAMLFGDALVPVHSASGRSKPEDRSAPFTDAHVRILPGMHHLQIAHDQAVYELIEAWYSEG